MVEFKSFQMFLILMIPFTAALTQHPSFITVTVGNEATLPCVRDDQDKCLSASWIFNYLKTGPPVTLFEYGKFLSDAASKSDRLSVTQKCSLVIKKVTFEDVGHYNCRHFDESKRQATHSDVYLTVTYRDDIATPPTTTTKAIKPTTRPPTTTIKRTTKATTRPTTTTTTKRTTKPTTTTKRTTKALTTTTTKRTTKATTTTTTATKRTTKPTTTTKRTTKATTTTTTKRTTKATTTTTTTTATKRTTKATTKLTTDPTAAETSQNTNLPAILIPVAVVLASLIIVAVIRWKRAKGNNTQVDDNTADPPDGVSYASIRYKKKTKSKAQVQDEDHGDDMVTYSTVNTSSTSAGASNDPRNLYASINKTK